MPSDLKVLLHEMSWTEAEEYFAKNNVAILPVGSTEQHGPANPLGTDHLIAKAIAEETANRVRVLCLPVIPFGVSSHHKQFWGTIYVSQGTFKEYVKEVCLALAYYDVRKIVIVNGHGGNLASLKELARELRVDGIFITVFQWWLASPKLLPKAFTTEERGHAGAEETSVNLALHPTLVNMDRALDEEPCKPVVVAEGITLPLESVDETSSGVFGRQKSASAKKGKRVFESVVNELIRHVELIKKVKVEDFVEKPKVKRPRRE